MFDVTRLWFKFLRASLLTKINYTLHIIDYIFNLLYKTVKITYEIFTDMNMLLDQPGIRSARMHGVKPDARLTCKSVISYCTL